MSGGVQTVEVAGDDDGVRLDRWFKRNYPGLSHGRLEKLLRTGQIRVEGKRSKAAQRLEAGQMVRVPPQATAATEAPKQRKDIRREQAVEDPELTQMLQSSVLSKDDDVIVINKPSGLATQGGTGIKRSIDSGLDALRFGADERPKLVHRLDKDTSGVMLIARGSKQARWLTTAFRDKAAQKIYWALVVGEMPRDEGTVDLPIAKLPGKGGERMEIDEENGKRAVTHFSVVERFGSRAAWVAMMPITGRTHQLRVHMAAIGTPIQGDGKYGGQEAFLVGAGVSRKLNLHAREISLVRPNGSRLVATAPLSDHMVRSWEFFGSSEKEEPNASARFEQFLD